MLRFFNVSICFILFSCSGIKPYSKKNQNFLSNIVVQPGEITQVFLPGNFKGDIIKCSNGIFPVSKGDRPYFIYAESYFSDMKKKSCIDSNINITVEVIEKTFPFEELKVDRKRVNLNKKDLKRVIREREILKDAYSHKSHFFKLMNNFKLPLNSKVTSDYGKRRLYNKERKGQHLGIDFRAKVGKEIPAANEGIVVLAQDLFYTGNTVILYHGLGIFTVYGHLSKINVQKNQKITKDQIIGLAGMTGRVTGPHLHWGVKVNGQWVNGKDLLTLKLKP